MDNQDNNQESSMRPWIIYLVIFRTIFMLLMAGRNKTEDSTEITYDPIHRYDYQQGRRG